MTDTPEDVGRSMAEALRDSLAGYHAEVDPDLDRVAALDAAIALLQELRDAWANE